MDKNERRLRRGVLQTRLLVSAAVLVMVAVTDAFERPGFLAALIVLYALLAYVLWELSARVVRWRQVRAVPIALDLAGISLIVWSTGGIGSSWYLLYLFPVLSVARYLGVRRSLAIAGLAIVGYGIACYADAGVLPPLDAFGLRAVILAAVALTAGRPEEKRQAAEARLRTAIDAIDHAIMARQGLDRVISLLLDAAMAITHSEFSAIRLTDGTARAAGRQNTDYEPSEVEAAASILSQHYPDIMADGKALTLPLKDRSAPAAPRQASGAERWTARLEPLKIGADHLGVLGVFSRRRLQFTHDDVRRLSNLAHMVAIAQKNAKLYVESQARIRLLYDVGEGLKSEQSLQRLFCNVVRLVSDHLGSEEAALFLPSGSDGHGAPEGNGALEKVAVAGPREGLEQELMEQQELYERPGSLTRKVFDDNTPLCNNHVPPDEVHAEAYARLLPSRMIPHYLGAPLVIGSEVLGVIRVLNKKAKNYEPEEGKAVLAEEGFSEEDLELLSAIATQVASAIRNARFVEQHAHFKNLVYNSPHPTIVIDGSGRVLHFNRASEKLWGRTEEEVRGTDVKKLYKSDAHAKEIGAEMWEAARRGEGIQDWSAWVRKSGPDGDQIIPIRLAAAGLLDKEGRRSGSIGVFTDEREEMRRREQEIRNTQLAALGRIAHAKGHDIKHDIATILFWVDILRDGSEGDPELLDACSAIETATSRAMGKLQDMLMAADPKPPVMELVSLRTVLASFQASTSREAKATYVDFRVRYPDGDYLLLADAEQLRQLFTNLFGNSLDAIKRARELSPHRPAGRIDLDVTGGEDHVLLSWSDDGSGMSEEVRANAFKPLFTTKKTGSGLGLFIARTIVEGHGGTIGVEPVTEGGVRFTIRLPFQRQVQPQQTVQQVAETLEGGSGQ